MAPVAVIRPRLSISVWTATRRGGCGGDQCLQLDVAQRPQRGLGGLNQGGSGVGDRDHHWVDTDHRIAAHTLTVGATTDSRGTKFRTVENASAGLP